MQGVYSVWSIVLVQGLEDLEDWTLAQYGLGQLYVAIGDFEKALPYYRQARAGYLFLGDTRFADVLKRRIERLEKTTSNLLRLKS